MFIGTFGLVINFGDTDWAELVLATGGSVVAGSSSEVPIPMLGKAENLKTLGLAIILEELFRAEGVLMTCALLIR